MKKRQRPIFEEEDHLDDFRVGKKAKVTPEVPFQPYRYGATLTVAPDSMAKKLTSFLEKSTKLLQKNRPKPIISSFEGYQNLLKTADFYQNLLKTADFYQNHEKNEIVMRQYRGSLWRSKRRRPIKYFQIQTVFYDFESGICRSQDPNKGWIVNVVEIHLDQPFFYDTPPGGFVQVLTTFLNSYDLVSYDDV
jgi:hypothetical protein